VRQADKDSRLRTRQGRRVKAGVLDGFPRGLQQQPVLRVDRDGFRLRHPEEAGIEGSDGVQKGAPPRHRSARHTRFRAVVGVGIPPVSRNLVDEVGSAQQGLPEPLRRVDAAGKPARQTDHGD